MKTVLVLTNSSATYQLLSDSLSDRARPVLLAAPPDATRAKFDALFTTWLRLVDVVILDADSLGEASRWAVESLAAARLTDQQAVVVRATALQQTLFTFPRGWLVLADTEGAEQLCQSLDTFFQLRDTQTKLARADVLLARQRQTAPAVPVALQPLQPVFDSYRYRDALKTLSHVLGQRLDEKSLLNEFLRLVKDLLGVSKLALFTRETANDFSPSESGLRDGQLVVGASHGIAQPIIDHFRLTLETGIGGYVAREARIVRRAQCVDQLALDFDPQLSREFELLGTEVAVPMFDNDELLGVLTFNGKITGELLTNEELELAYYLMGRLAQAIRNLNLLDRLAAQQRLVGEVLLNVQSGVVVVSEAGRVLSLNPCARRLLELEDRDPVGQSLSALPGRVADTLFEALQAAYPLPEREIVLPRSNRPLGVRVTRFPLNCGPAHATQLVAVALIDDLTQAKQQQAQARELADKEFLTRLAARLSHELKNSLVCIKTFAQLLPERYEDHDFRDQCSSVVSNEVNRIDVLISNLTFFSHPLALVYEEVKLSDILDACLKRIGTEFERKKAAHLAVVGEKGAPEPPAGIPVIAVKRNYAHKPPQLQADRIRLTQAVEHLLRNAIQAMPGGGRLNLSTADATAADFADGKLPAGGGVRIDCFDSGEGIALENLPRVTEPFVTTRNVGVGLGLTIVKKIIERHSGRLLIDSVLGRSTTIGIVLPVHAQPHPEDELVARLSQAEPAVRDDDAAATVRRVTKPVPAPH